MWRRSAKKGQDESATPAPDAIRMTVFVSGMVQGVGFRWWTRSHALEIGLVGSARNLVDGRVEIVVEGTREQCDTLLGILRGSRTPGRVTAVVEQFSDARGGLRRFDAY